MIEARGAALLIAIGLLAAALCNGAGTYLKRVGLLEGAAYSGYMAQHCPRPYTTIGPFGNSCSCIPPQNFGKGAELRAAEVRGIAADQAYLYSNAGHLLWLKVAKEVLFAGFVLLSLWLGRKSLVSALRAALRTPLAVLAASVALGAVVSLASWGAGYALIGLRSFEFLAIAGIGAWMSEHLRYCATAIAVLLAVQLGLVLFEFLYGMPLRTCPHSFRVSGAMVMPNSLGVMAVSGLAFCFSFLRRGVCLWLLQAVVVLLVMTSGSGSALVALFGLYCLLWISRAPASRRAAIVIGAMLLAVGLAVALPVITSRPDIYYSVFGDGGRVAKLHAAVAQSSPLQMLIGHGIGFGSNTAANASGKAIGTQNFANAPGAPVDIDSTAVSLFSQIGIVGVLAFYALLAWGFVRDPRARPVYLTVALVSLFINVNEVFPVNFLLGLVLARCVERRSDQAAKAADPT